MRSATAESASPRSRPASCCSASTRTRDRSRFPSATAYDADAAAWLMANGADMEVLNQYLEPDAGRPRSATCWTSSQPRWRCGTSTASRSRSASPRPTSTSTRQECSTHYVVEDLGYRVAIAVVRMPERVQVVARSRLAEVDVGAVMTLLGGGGHAQAASARFRDETTDEVLEPAADRALAEVVAPPLRASDVMTAPVRHATPAWTMRRAGELMATWGHGGLPVVETWQARRACHSQGRRQGDAPRLGSRAGDGIHDPRRDRGSARHAACRTRDASWDARCRQTPRRRGGTRSSAS